MSAVLGPNKDLGTGEQEVEQKHSFSQTQTWQLKGLAEEEQAEQGKHDVAEERQIGRQHIQLSIGNFKVELDYNSFFYDS